MEIPYGYCHCGCGQQTTICARTDRGAHKIKGEPHRYVYGHHKIGKKRGLGETELPCTTCLKVLPATSFTWCNTHKAYQSYCKSCRSRYSKYYHKTKKYNLSEQQYND